MIPKHIIKKAIAGGWMKGIENDSDLMRLEIMKRISNDPWKAICDPNFWTALGKEKEWDTCSAFHGQQWEGVPHWKYEAFRFYDLILRKASQEEIDNFWKSL